MRRRYGRCEPERRGRSSWFILFFLLIAIFFFNYFGRKLGQVSNPPFPVDVALYDHEGRLRHLRFSRGFTVVVLVSRGCSPCERQIEELKRLDVGWAKWMVIFLDGPVPKGMGEGFFSVHPKDVERLVEALGVERVPITFIVDSSGLIRRRIEGYIDASDLEAFLRVVKRYGI